jgi:transcription initiation factor IIE alpha subunit
MKQRNHLNREETLVALFRKIQNASQSLLAEELTEEELPTAASLAREMNIRLEEVKKRLQTLRDEDLVQALGLNPKRYRLNAWQVKAAQKEEKHAFHFLFVDSEQDENRREWQDY